MGDRRAFLGRAVGELRRLGSVRVSGEFFSEAEGFESENGFMNLAAELVIESERPLTEADALGILRHLQGIERAISGVPHREADGSYRDREIDIDIIAVEGLRMNTPELTLPHPRAAAREFVTAPLQELVGADKLRELLF